MGVPEISRFEKVSFDRFKEDCHEYSYWFSDSEIKDYYDNINIPKRKTEGSAGHDINIPFDLWLSPGETAMIPTGLRCCMDNNYVMLIFPRSSMGIKKKMTISNTIPVIDSDYYLADNEGHILISIKNNDKDCLKLKSNTGFAQAVFVPFGIAIDSGNAIRRTGGIGSTDAT